jgi:hypothetical protein
LLLDFAHLKVSCKSLGLDFIGEVSNLFSLTDYYHISGNNGLHDQNHSIFEDTDMVQVLGNYNWKGKTITIEVYENIDSLCRNVDFLHKKINK